MRNLLIGLGLMLMTAPAMALPEYGSVACLGLPDSIKNECINSCNADAAWWCSLWWTDGCAQAHESCVSQCCQDATCSGCEEPPPMQDPGGESFAALPPGLIGQVAASVAMCSLTGTGSGEGTCMEEVTCGYSCRWYHANCLGGPEVGPPTPPEICDEQLRVCYSMCGDLCWPREVALPPDESPVVLPPGPLGQVALGVMMCAVGLPEGGYSCSAPAEVQVGCAGACTVELPSFCEIDINGDPVGDLCQNLYSGCLTECCLEYGHEDPGEGCHWEWVDSCDDPGEFPSDDPCPGWQRLCAG